jgi:hypothetical protein
MVAGLAKELAKDPKWAGRLGVDERTGGRAILLTGEGARLVEATTDVALDVVPSRAAGSRRGRWEWGPT